MNKTLRLAGGLLLLSTVLTGCTALFKPAAITPRTAFVKCDFLLNPAPSGPATALLASLEQSLRYYKARPAGETICLGAETYTVAQMQAALQALIDKLKSENSPGRLNDWLRANFTAYRPVTKPVLVTAYCQPRLHGSKQPSPKYAYPLYRLPDDLVYLKLGDFMDAPGAQFRIGRLTPEHQVLPGYFTREEIDFKQALVGKGYELYWVDCLADAYFLQVEGSGVIEFEDGTTTRVAYAGKNGHPYRGLGGLFIQEGILQPEEVSIPRIKDYLAKHPEAVKRILASNPSYVFFKQGQAEAYGNLQLPLTPFHSAAVDQSLFPPAGLGCLNVTLPEFDVRGNSTGARVFQNLVLFQDRGGAIQGPDRLDLFCGEGPEAEALAGNLKALGEVYILAPKASGLDGNFNANK